LFQRHFTVGVNTATLHRPLHYDTTCADRTAAAGERPV